MNQVRFPSADYTSARLVKQDVNHAIWWEVAQRVSSLRQKIVENIVVTDDKKTFRETIS